MKIPLLIVLISSTLLFVTQQQIITIAIIGTNDIHGTAFPAEMIRADNQQKYKYGGLQYMGGLIQIIKAENPGHVIYLDAGDQFQGGIQSSKLVSSGKIMNDFYAALSVDGSAIGNHEFDFGPNFLLPFMSGKDSPNLAANIRSQKNQDVFLPNQQISHMFQFVSGIKIGVIGLATIQTPTTTNAFVSGLFPNYKFLQYSEIIVQQSKKLRKKGANAIILVGHVGNDCPLNLTYGIWTEQMPQNPCQTSDQVSKLIDSLPNGTIDGVVQGHRHVIAHHFRKGIPYMGSINGGYYFNIMYLAFDAKKNVIKKTIQGPVPVCQKIFQKLGRCNYLTKHELVDAGNLINWKFHNKDVLPHPKVKAIYEQQWAPKMNPYLEELVQSEIYLKISWSQENQLANLITNLMHKSVPMSDFALVNPGSFRTQWLPGIIQYQHFYNMFPFDNQLQTFQITGAEILKMIEVLQTGSKGLYHFYGLSQILEYNQSTKQYSITNVKFSDGTEIIENQSYTGLATDFMLNGGDDFRQVIDKKAYIPRKVKNQGDLKILMRPQLIKWGKIQQGTLLDGRLVVNKV